MNIYAKAGARVRVVEKGNELVASYYPNVEKLEMDAIYTISYTNVHSWHTDVYLKEFPGVHFNSVCFEDVK